METREIKFRGKRTDELKGWVYGHLFESEFKSWIFYEMGHESFDGEVSEYEADLEWVEVDPETVGQYTGLNDKKDVDIYVGDIVRFKFGKGMQVSRVEFTQDHDYGYSLSDAGIMLSYIYTEKIQLEVIGNTTDNPELLSNPI